MSHGKTTETERVVVDDDDDDDEFRGVTGLTDETNMGDDGG